jgi:hypothetical protein
MLRFESGRQLCGVGHLASKPYPNELDNLALHHWPIIADTLPGFVTIDDRKWLMANPASSLLTKVRSRLINMLALADSYTILYLMGPELGPRMVGVMWSATVMGGFYGQSLSSAADQILDASPELGELLSSDVWEATVMAPYYARVQDQIHQQISPVQLEEFRANLSEAEVGLIDHRSN